MSVDKVSIAGAHGEGGGGILNHIHRTAVYLLYSTVEYMTHLPASQVAEEGRHAYSEV